MNIKLLLLMFLAIILNKTGYTQTMKKAFINGKIYTVNNKQPIAEAVFIEDNKISFVGSNSDINKLIDNITEVVDLKGKLMLPGFIDDHTHFINGGHYLLGIDLRKAKSTLEFKNILKNYAEKNQVNG